MKSIRQLAIAARLGALCTIATAAEQRRALDSIDYAYFLCQVLTRSPATTDCKVPGGNFSVDVTIDATSAQARKVCADASSEMAKLTRVFNDEWKLRTLSPYSADKAIAVCTLH